MAMFVELPQTLILVTAGAFLLGWLLSYISSRLSARFRATRRDPRDDRIRSLEAELRVAKTDASKSHDCAEQLEEQLKETTIGLERRDNVISEQQSKLETVTRDLKESVLKTRELRSELAERAVENVHAEAKIRDVQTELSVAHASKDMLDTGVLDYKFSPDDDEAEDADDGKKAETGKAAR